MKQPKSEPCTAPATSRRNFERMYVFIAWEGSVKGGKVRKVCKKIYFLVAQLPKEASVTGCTHDRQQVSLHSKAPVIKGETWQFLPGQTGQNLHIVVGGQTP